MIMEKSSQGDHQARTMRTVASVTVPMGIGLALVAPELILVLFGSRWAASAELLSREPALRDLSQDEARLTRLERQGRALTRWPEASESEARAVQRRLPGLFRALDVSAVGHVRLRPGPGGALVLDEGS